MAAPNPPSKHRASTRIEQVSNDEAAFAGGSTV
jgi:hypothetical protein